MGWKRDRFRRYLTLLCAAALISCAPVEESTENSDPEISDNASDDALVGTPPSVASFSPTSGAQGTVVTIRGTYLGPTTTVSFNGTPARVIPSTTSVRAYVPDGATSGSIVVKTDGGTVTAGTFTVLAKVSSITPKTVYPGESFTVGGSGFTGATAVLVGSTNCPSFTVVNDTSINVVLPAGATGGAVTVTKGSYSTASRLTVARTFGVKSFDPKSGPVGTQVTISGGGFANAQQVLFGRASARFTVVDDATIQASVPEGALATSAITVVTPSGKKTSSSTFAVSLMPLISAFKPVSAALPATATLSGRNFTTTTGVTLGGRSVGFRVVSDLVLEVQLPVSIGSVTAPFVVTNPGGTATSSTSFEAVDLCARVVCRALDQCHEAGVCDPANGTCSNPIKSDGASCNDGDACTQTDSCQAGVCAGANLVVCTASDQCHDAGSCDPTSGLCSNPEKANGSSCDDGNACTQTDSCEAGACTGQNPVTCVALDQCHDAGSCDPATGACSAPAKQDGAACTDGNACTQADTCQAGTCTGANPVVCGGADSCHAAGSCDPSTGACSAPVQTGECDTNNTNPPVVASSKLGGGYYHSCQVRDDGTLNCWGGNWYGQVGNGNTQSPSSQALAVGLSNVVAVSGGESHTCALLGSGEVSCWGYNYYGQTGTADYQYYRTSPTLVPDLNDAVAISAGGYHTCALRASGDVTCWGANWSGQLGGGDNTTNYYWDYTLARRTVSGLSNIVQIAAGHEHTCAVDDQGAVYCWGGGWAGNLGDGNYNNSFTPVQVQGISDAVQVAAGQASSCAVRATGEVVCWGYGPHGQLGDGNYGYQVASPVAVQGLTDAVSLTGGSYHFCALREAGEVACWGNNSDGQLGDGNMWTNAGTPNQVVGLTGVVSIDAGEAHTCAVDGANQVYCWGRGDNGQLGGGSWQQSVSTPQVLPDCSQGSDNDGDGSVDACDADDDNDNVRDTDESSYGTNPLLADTDSDGLSDQDEVNRSWYNSYCGYNDWWYYYYYYWWYYSYYQYYCNQYTNPTVADTDGDGLNDGLEVYQYSSYPNKSDTDDDGLADGQEVELGTYLYSSDSDGDGLSDGNEVNYYLSSPLSYDSDGDGLSDGNEISFGTSPTDSDSDDDGTSDLDEYNYDGDQDGMAGWQEAQYGTDPNLADTDSDGLTDYQEIFQYGTPALQADGDGDGLTDAQERLTYNTNVWSWDTDGDGLGDGDEVNIHHTSPTDVDSDGDDLSDYQEIQNGTNPNQISDTDEDGLADSDEINSFLTSASDADSDDDGINDLADLLGLADNNISVQGKDCEDIIVNGGSTSDGYYYVDADGDGPMPAHAVYCDMNTDTMTGYTYLKVSRSNSVEASVAEAYCTRRGMKLFVPRTQAHLSSAYALATNANIGGNGSANYLFIMGIYPKWSGATCYGTPLRSDNPSCNWRANDDGRFWVGEATWIGEPNGDNNPGASMGYWFNEDGSINWYNDTWSSYMSSQFLCGVSE